MTNTNTNTQTPQQKLQAQLEAIGIPYKEIKVYGSQVMITAWSETAAKRWYNVICRFTNSRGPVRSVENNKVNKNTCLLPSYHEVWLVGGTVNI